MAMRSVFLAPEATQHVDPLPHHIKVLLAHRLLVHQLELPTFTWIRHRGPLKLLWCLKGARKDMGDGSSDLHNAIHTSLPRQASEASLA